MNRTETAAPWEYSIWEFEVSGYAGNGGDGCGTANAAQGHPAKASSTENAGTPASAAVDGNAGTRWSSGFSDPQWVQVDLGVTASICQVVLYWEAAYATAYQIQVSADAVNWTSIYSTTTGTGGTQTLNVTGAGRYLRMYGTARATPYGYSLWEITVHTGSGDSTPPGPPGTPALVSVTFSSVTIGWSAASDNVGVTGYDVYHDGQLCAQVNGATLTAICNNLNPNV